MQSLNAAERLEVMGGLITYLITDTSARAVTLRHACNIYYELVCTYCNYTTICAWLGVRVLPSDVLGPRTKWMDHLSRVRSYIDVCTVQYAYTLSARTPGVYERSIHNIIYE